MPFHEKSAWVMSVALLSCGVLYFGAVVAAWSESGQLMSPLIPLIVIYTVCLVVIAIVGHIAIAVLAPKDATAPVDERERQIFSRAGHYSSYVFAVGILISLGIYLISNSGDLLFYTVFASLMVAQITEYFFQILFYRTSI
jgi:cytochrome b561